MGAEADTNGVSPLSGALRVTLVAAVIGAIGAAYWFAYHGAPEVPVVERGGQVERIVALTRPPDEPSDADESDTAALPAEETASALAAGQEPGDAAPAAREFASLDEVTFDIGDGQQTRLTSGSDGTLSIHELSAVDSDISPVLGGRITLVSVTEPSMLMLDNGERFSLGSRMPNGHVVAAIEREQIVLERDGVVSVIRLP